MARRARTDVDPHPGEEKTRTIRKRAQTTSSVCATHIRNEPKQSAVLEIKTPLLRITKSGEEGAGELRARHGHN